MRLKKQDMYLRMADYIEKNGFHPAFMKAPGSKCGCFLHAHVQIIRATVASNLYPRLDELRDLIGGCFSESGLRSNGWTGPAATRDAAAACRIAADLCAR